MGKLKNSALAKAPNSVRKSPPVSTATAASAAPTKFTYALAAYTAEIRDKGWYVAKTVPSFAGQKPEWSGPFETIETAVLAIGRRLATEIADRHTRMIEQHKIKPDAPLYGMKPTTRLRAKSKLKGSVA